MISPIDRREFLGRSAFFAAEVGIMSMAGDHVYAQSKQPLFSISLAEWSLNRTLFAGKLDNLDFAKTAKSDFGIDAVEYVNQFFKDKATDQKYLSEMKKRAVTLESRMC